MTDNQSPVPTYRIEVEDLTEVTAPVLVHTLRGSLDAGGVGDLLARHLKGSLPARRVATFDVDEYIDYRSRRPAMEFEDFEFTAYHEPVLALDLLKDDEGQPLLLLHGSEPDLRWDTFVEDVTELITKLGVQHTLGVHGFPGPVPHSRPSPVHAHGAKLPNAPQTRAIMLGKVQLPSTASSLLEFRLNESGHKATGVAVTVPHYLAQNEFPQAAAEAVRWISKATGLALPVGELEADAAEVAAQVNAHLEQNPEVAAVVEALERQYDEITDVRANQVGDDRSLPASSTKLPSADEIGAEAEAFLAEMVGDALRRPQQSDAAEEPAEDAKDGEPAGTEPGPDESGRDVPAGGEPASEADREAGPSADPAAGEGNAPAGEPAPPSGAEDDQPGDDSRQRRPRWPWQR